MTDVLAGPFLRPDKFWLTVGLRANQTVVHLGCGAGFFLNPAAKIVGSRGQVIGVDIREDILQEAENRAERAGLSEIVTTIRTDLEKGSSPTIKANISDWTLVVNILDQADPKKVLQEAKRITKAGGTIVIVEWSTTQATIGPPVEQRITKETVLQIISALKLSLDREFEPSPYHYGLLIEV